MAAARNNRREKRVSWVTVLRRAMVDTDFIADGILEGRDELLEILSPDLR